MAFWGIEVKAGRPYTHLYDNSRGRLRISQAALGSGKSTNKSSLQINVRNKSPVILCNLIPDVLETCHLELEFEEAEEVVFSVLGQRSVHLSGYYIGSSMRKLDGDETDSYGEDIADTDASGSYNKSDNEEEYESDFIDDDDIEMSPPVWCKSGVANEDIVEDEKPSNGNAKCRRLKKKHQGKPVVQHDNSAVLESEDEDCFPISFSLRRKITISDSEDDKIIDEDRKKKIDVISKDNKSTSLPCKETCHPCGTSQPSDIGQENNVKLKKKKDGKPLDVISRVPAEERENVKPDEDQGDKEVSIHKGSGFGEENGESIRSGVDGTETDGKKKKKKKGKISETAIEGTNEAVNNDKMDQDDKEGSIHMEDGVQFGEANDESRRAGVDGTETDGKEKKKKKKKGKISETAIEGTNEADVKDKMDQDDKEGGTHKEDRMRFEEANDKSKRAGVDGTETDKKEKKKKKKMKGKISEAATEGTNEADNNDKMDQDSSPVSNEMEKLPHPSEGAIPSILSAAAQETTGKLKKKSKKRTKDDRESEAEGEVADVIETGTRKKEKKNTHYEDFLVNQKLIEQGKLEATKAGLNSLVSPIEEDLAMGKPNSKIATLLKKV